MTAVEWRPVPDWPGYEVSNGGGVRSYRTRTGRLAARSHSINHMLSTAGYPYVWLCNGPVRKRWMIHRLVLFAFVGPPPNGLIGCHGDDDKLNSSLSNLRWDTSKANTADAVRRGRHRNLQKTHCPQGHEYSEQNTCITPQGFRACRACKRDQARRKDAARIACAQCGVLILPSNMRRHVSRNHAATAVAS